MLARGSTERIILKLSRAVRELLRNVFTDRIIALNHTIEWPPRSPDLTPCDFFLWGHLKSKVLKGKLDLVKRVIAGMRRKLQVCVERNGGRVERN